MRGLFLAWQSSIGSWEVYKDRKTDGRQITYLGRCCLTPFFKKPVWELSCVMFVGRARCLSVVPTMPLAPSNVNATLSMIDKT